MNSIERDQFLALLRQAANSERGIYLQSHSRSALKRILFEAKRNVDQNDPIHSLVFVLDPLRDDRLLLIPKEIYDREVKAEASPGSPPGGGSPETEGSLP